MLVPSDWGSIWTGRHQIAARLAREHPLIWVTPPRVWQESLTSKPRAARWSSAPQAPQVTVYEPPTWLPHVYRPGWLRDELFRRRLAQARRALIARGARRIVLYVWRPQFSRALDLVPHDLSVYHVNDEYSFSAKAEAPSAQESALLARSDLVFVHSPELMRRKGQVNPRTTMLPNGVDYDAFATPRPEPADLQAIARPRIGYVGWLKRHLDWAMLEDLVDARPHLSFVFIGPTSPHPELDAVIERLRTKPHVHFLGGRPAADLPQYVQHLDVCLLPYVDNAYTRCIYPLKLHESLAAGKPVVATSLPSIDPFDAVVEVVRAREGWVSSVDRAVLPEATSGPRVEERRRVAREHDWDLLVGRLSRILHAGIAESPASTAS
ncbi:MAG TPA: glycosyltransferase [Luteitalea sp.]|nr:glycosyltransferase [Luteitalea sp.]